MSTAALYTLHALTQQRSIFLAGIAAAAIDSATKSSALHMTYVNSQGDGDFCTRDDKSAKRAITCPSDGSMHAPPPCAVAVAEALANVSNSMVHALRAQCSNVDPASVLSWLAWLG